MNESNIMVAKTFLCSVLLLLVITLPSDCTPEGMGLCETLQTDMVIPKEKTYEYNGRTIRLMCMGKVRVNKCEGLCVSQVWPSVKHYPGFKKDCRCCREGRLKSRMITLDECYNGSKQVPGQTVTFFIQEPIECACLSCTV
ncbi:partner of bursicon-like [Tubulanus polymorphus]|uniref:partner of bursicon-like n=1 Tax=Tubulanus polymorphus TaxID=672921 RepID=UPI003DA4706C